MKNKNSAIKTGIIGCGNIGTELALFLDINNEFKLNTICDAKQENINSLLSKLSHRPSSADIKNSILKNDLIIESSNKEVVKKLLHNRHLDKPGKKLLVMSSGGLFENINSIKRIKNVEIFVPSGAISGLDAIKAVEGKIKYLQLTTIKPASSLKSAPYVLKHKIHVKKIRKIIFNGNLKEAVMGFPQNINVAASLFLASRFKPIRIRIIADPNSRFNKHEVICKGKFGTIKTITKNIPSKNPKTSYLAILSALSVLKNMNKNIKVGS